MKKILLVIAIFVASRINAQIVNGGFENWTADTSFFAGYTGILPGDTFSFQGPVGWTSGNGITGAAGLGSHILVTQTATAYSGNYALRLTTDTLQPITIPVLGVRQLTVPGLILNGNFAIGNITSNILGGGTISPAAVPGAGQAFGQRLAHFSGYYQYAPVQDTFTHTLDTCVMWATLRHGTTIVANAQFKTNAATGANWVWFNVPFTYVSCDMPDTLVVLLASSIPKFAGIINGSTELVPGSVLLVDDLNYDTLAASSSIVVAVNDVDTVVSHTRTAIPVQVNDCGTASPLTITIGTAPANGTATVSGDSIVYTSNAGFAGVDSIYYTDTDPNNVTSSAWLKLHVIHGVGISEANAVTVNMFPVPASNELHIQFENKGKTTAHIYDVVGNLVSVVTLTQNSNNINVANLTNGVYGIQLLDESNTVIARTKFVVSK